jgi:hypothetical protein
MQKKGQVTLFIILGIIILVIAAILAYVYGARTTTEGQQELNQPLTSSSLEPIKELIKTCTKISIEKGIIKIGLQGGYYQPAYFVQLGNYSVSYAYINNQNRLPTLYQISKEIEKYTSSEESQKEVEECIDDFKNFKKSYSMDIEDYEIKVGEISDTSIPIEVNYPITVSKDDVSLELDKVAYNIDSGIGTAYKVATDITNSEVSSGTFDIDGYIISHVPLATIERQRDADNLFYYLESITQDTEQPFKYHFIIKK